MTAHYVFLVKNKRVFNIKKDTFFSNCACKTSFGGLKDTFLVFEGLKTGFWAKNEVSQSSIIFHKVSRDI